MSDDLPDGWGDPASPENAERIGEWVWCPVVWAVLSNDGCEFDKRHQADCQCGSRYPLSVTPLDPVTRAPSASKETKA